MQLKGRMSGKGGKASKKVWEWGRTSASNLADPVDYAHKAVVTRAGYIGIKVGAGATGMVVVVVAAGGRPQGASAPHTLCSLLQASALVAQQAAAGKRCSAVPE